MHHPPLAQHLYVSRLLGYGWGLTIQDVLPFIVVEFAEHGTMRDYLIEKKPCLSHRLHLCSQVYSALQELHRSGIAHGDLKLENVLIFPQLPEPIAKLVSRDFQVRVKLEYLMP
jgi:serine/threonine protein kinase